MLAKAHITIGLAAACTVMMPHTAEEAIPVIAGAAAGCLIPDIDSEASSERISTSKWRYACIGLTGLALLADYLTGGAFIRSAELHWPYLWFAGLAGFALTCTFASVSSHRGFSHSLAAMLIETGSLWLMFPAAALPFAIAFASHLALDLTNKRPVKLLYPVKKGFCLGLFYADRFADKVCTLAGTLWLLIVLYKCAIG